MGVISHDICHPPTARVDTADLSGSAIILSFRASSKKEAATSGGWGAACWANACAVAPPDRNHTCEHGF